jgi:hypothetical protein
LALMSIAFEQAAAAFVKWEVHTFRVTECDSASRGNQRLQGINPYGVFGG